MEEGVAGSGTLQYRPYDLRGVLIQQNALAAAYYTTDSPE